MPESSELLTSTTSFEMFMLDITGLSRMARYESMFPVEAMCKLPATSRYCACSLASICAW